jgi:hypothetical protein
MLASNVKCGDTNHRVDASGEPVDNVAIGRIDDRPNPVFAGFRARADGSQLEARDPCQVEKAAKDRVHIARIQLQNEHN